MSLPLTTRLARIQLAFSDAAYAAGWSIVCHLPASLTRQVFRYGAKAAAAWGEYPQLRRNLARVIGNEPSDQLILRSLESYARYWEEAFRLPAMDLDDVHRQISSNVQGKEHIRAALDQGRGVILSLPHSGNWDMAGVWLVKEFCTFTTVAERLRPESLYQRFVRFRESLGFRVIPHTGGDVPPYAQLKDTLEKGGIVCLLGERDLRQRGIEVLLFGEKTRMPAGPAKLAKDTHAVLCPVHCWFDNDAWGIDIGAPVDTSLSIEEITQEIAHYYEDHISQHPEDWHMLQPLWIDDLSEGHRRHIEEGN